MTELALRRRRRRRRAVRGRAEPAGPAADRGDHRRAGARAGAARPGADRAAAPPLRRRRGAGAARPVRRPRALGRHAQAVPVDAHRRPMVPGLHRRHRGRPGAAVHLRLRGRRHRSTCTRCATARSRCCSCSAARSSPAARPASPSTQVPVGPRGALPAAGRGLARPDGRALPGQRVAAARPDTLDALAHYKARARAHQLGRRGRPTLLAEARSRRGEPVDDARAGPARRRRGALRGLPALPVPRDVAQEPGALAVRRARAARCGRGRGRRGAPTWRSSACCARTPAAAAPRDRRRAPALPAAAAAVGRAGRAGRRGFTAGRRAARRRATSGPTLGRGGRGRARARAVRRSPSCAQGATLAVEVAGGEDVEPLHGRAAGPPAGRRRWRGTACSAARPMPDGDGLLRLRRRGRQHRRGRAATRTRRIGRR